MRILAISGSLRRDSHNRSSSGRQRVCCRPGRELDVLEPDALRDIPHYDEDLREAGEPLAVDRAARTCRARRRGPRLHPGVQPLAPGCAEERDRLAVTPARREPVPRHGRRRRRGEHRHVRRRLGAGRGAEGPRRRRRARPRRGAPGRPRARAVRARRRADRRGAARRARRAACGAGGRGHTDLAVAARGVRGEPLAERAQDLARDGGLLVEQAGEVVRADREDEQRGQGRASRAPVASRQPRRRTARRQPAGRIARLRRCAAGRRSRDGPRRPLRDRLGDRLRDRPGRDPRLLPR